MSSLEKSFCLFIQVYVVRIGPLSLLDNRGEILKCYELIVGI